MLACFACLIYLLALLLSVVSTPSLALVLVSTTPLALNDLGKAADVDAVHLGHFLDGSAAAAPGTAT